MRHRDPFPPLLQQSQVEKIAELQRREFDLGWELLHPFTRLLQDWRSRVEQLFLRAHVTSLRPDRQAVWDTSVATREILDIEIAEPLRRERAAVEEEMIPITEERQRVLFLLGALFARWQLAVGGIDPTEPLPSPTRSLGRIDGGGFHRRLKTHGQIFQAKAERALRAAVLSGETLPETLVHVDALSTRYEGEVTRLGRNEGRLGAEEGQRAALVPYRALLAEIWVCKPGACEAICKPRHLLVTPLVPIRDSHPNCRCEKIPLVHAFTPTPIAFTTFATRHDQRPLAAL